MRLLCKLSKLLPSNLRDYLTSVICLRYFPKVSNPTTFNEKILSRKRNWKNGLFVTCSDKVKVKEYVSHQIGDKYIIPTLFVGDALRPDDLYTCYQKYGPLVVKANHNSGPVYIINDYKDEVKMRAIVDDINRQLTVDFGEQNNETWYSKITPQVLIEKKIESVDSLDLLDYKFHVFHDTKGGGSMTILHVDFDRNSNHNRSFFDEELNYLPIQCKYPTVKTKIKKPENFDEMLSVAKKLAQPFDYVRVDLYNVDGRIYFGEMTFAHEAGWGRFNTKVHDRWMGNHWK